MKKNIYGLATLMLLASLAFAQAPTAIIKIEGYSPQELLDLKWTSPRSTSLPNVGLGQIVYLIGRDSLNAAVTTYAWSLMIKPSGSAAVLDSANKKQTTFKPDKNGKYTVQLVVTTAGGASKPRTAVINAGKFVGLGELSGGISNPADGQCALCHSTNFAQWKKTGHSSFFTRVIDGEPALSSHYNESCIECHTTGFDGDPNISNDGFASVQKELGWKFPAKLQPGNWDTLKLKYPKLAQRANIQCESCHGPGSEHKGIKDNIAMSLDEAVCGYCHEEEPYHRKSTQWKSSLHAVGVASASTNASCTKCHSGWGFVRRVDPIPNDKRPTSGFPQISCAVCHDQHRADLPSQVRSLDDVTLGDSVTVVKYGGLGKVCMQCHISRRDAEDYTNTVSNLSTNFGPHHSNQADMLDGSNAIEYGVPIGTSGHKFAVKDACVTCHMQATPATGTARDKIGEHSFAMKWDGGTPTDPNDDVENVAVCQTCHGPIKSFDDILAKADFDHDGSIKGTRHEIEGMIAQLDKLLPPRTSTTLIKQNYDWTLPGLSLAEVAKRKAYTKAWYNWRFVAEDGSDGVHNAGYSIALLQRSIASITTGDIGSGKIVSITDIPNDQGKQVRMAWAKFPGDGVSTNPITGYSLWRRVDKKSANAGNISVNSKETMLAQASTQSVGKTFSIAQAGTWDFVAWIPSAGYEFYSMVAPTLYDSTAKDRNWSVFFVAGHGRGQLYESAPDSGYSVDNLAPFAPNNFTVKGLTGTNLELSWAEPEDTDFQYFTLYRSTTENFDPKGTKPLSTVIGTKYADTDVQVGTKYYYWLSAFDIAGNESKFSKASFTVGIAERGGSVPTEYALEQNYPNPFWSAATSPASGGGNPETMIKYQLSGASYVRLRVFTALGQEVRTLVDGLQPAQYYSIPWDGRDNAGNQLPTGLYFYRLETEKFTAVKKMVMMR